METKRLRSVGLDVGTTSTQLVVSELEVENRAGSFSVPELVIGQRRILYESPVHFTPLLGDALVDGEGIRRIVEQEYRAAGICREDVDTGAVIITGETSRKENARAVVAALAELAGDFVVATAGPELESILAAKGAGAVAFSAASGKRVLHIDIGGGTSNLALIEDGRIVKTGCMNVGGRLIKTDHTGAVCYLSPVLKELCKLKMNEIPTADHLRSLTLQLTRGLEMAAGLRQPDDLLEQLWTKEAGRPWQLEHPPEVISFSGGVADCIAKQLPENAFGDIGPLLGQTIRSSLLCRGAYRLGEQTIRATVIGAGCHSAQLSGSTVFYRNIRFPLKNLPVIPFHPLRDQLQEEYQQTGGILALQLPPAPSFAQLEQIAGALAALPLQAMYVAMEQDAAKALGQLLALQLPAGMPCLCIDGVHLEAGSFLEVGEPVGPALPVVIRTLVLQQ